MGIGNCKAKLSVKVIIVVCSRDGGGASGWVGLGTEVRYLG